MTSLLLASIVKQAGLPDGVFSVLPGYGAITGKALVSHPLVKKVDVTGGTPSGRAIGAIAGGNLAKFTAELGGKAPVIVTQEADLELAVNGVVFGSFIASGQTCVAATRIIVESSILSRFLEKLVPKVQSIERRMGNPINAESMMGSMISEKQLQGVVELVEEALGNGVSVLTGGKVLHGVSALDGFDFGKGWFYPPTVLTDGPAAKIIDSKIWKEEAFGPVIVVVPFEGEDEAIALANDSEFGLGAAIWSQNLSQAYRLADAIESGICWGELSSRCIEFPFTDIC